MAKDIKSPLTDEEQFQKTAEIEALTKNLEIGKEKKELKKIKQIYLNIS